MTVRRSSQLPCIAIVVGALLLAQICLVVFVGFSRSSKSEKSGMKSKSLLVKLGNHSKFLAVQQRMPPTVGFTLFRTQEFEPRSPPDENTIHRHSDVFFDQFSSSRSKGFTPERVEAEKSNWKHFYQLLGTMESPPEFSRPRFGTRGIVVSCGGRYFGLCLANLKILVEVHRTKLPIEAWYSENELSRDQVAELDLMSQKWGVPTRRKFEEIVPLYNLWLGNTLKGQTNIGTKNFHMKLIALVGSRFAEVLWLDADNTVARNPDYLFDLPEFRTTGAIFWSDMYSLSETTLAWSAMDLEPRKMWSQESGQILIDKIRCWRELFVVAYLNQRQSFWYSVVNGDKDTFLLTWMATKTPFYMIKFPPFPAGVGGIKEGESFCGNSFVQSDPSGNPIFIHSVNNKDISFNTANRKWLTLRPFDPAKAEMTYRWKNACIDLDEIEAGSAKAIPFSQYFGNLEDALFYYFHQRDSPKRI